MCASELICLALLCVSLSGGAEPAGFDEARRLYYAGIDGDSDAAGRSAKLFHRLAQAHPSDALIRAYFGSTRLLESARTFAVWKKGKLAKEGLTALDSAVAAAPDHLEVRFVRAMSTYHLPGLFHRGEQSREDFEKLAAGAEEAAAQGRLEPRLAAAALLYHGEFREKQSDRAGARKAWEAARRAGPGTKAGLDAAKRLH